MSPFLRAQCRKLGIVVGVYAAMGVQYFVCQFALVYLRSLPDDPIKSIVILWLFCIAIMGDCWIGVLAMNQSVRDRTQEIVQ